MLAFKSVIASMSMFGASINDKYLFKSYNIDKVRLTSTDLEPTFLPCASMHPTYLQPTFHNPFQSVVYLGLNSSRRMPHPGVTGTLAGRSVPLPHLALI